VGRRVRGGVRGGGGSGGGDVRGVGRVHLVRLRQLKVLLRGGGGLGEVGEWRRAMAATMAATMAAAMAPARAAAAGQSVAVCGRGPAHRRRCAP
jgi:hypothetical protein